MLALCSALAAPHLAERLDASRRPRGRRRGACRGRPGCRRCRARASARTPRGSSPAALHRLDQRRARARSRSGRRSAIGAGTDAEPRRATPSSPASRIVRSTRTGDIGWLGPKSYSVSVGSKTTVAGPAHAGMRRTLPVPWACASIDEPPAGGPPDGGPTDRAHPLPRPPTGGRSASPATVDPWAPSTPRSPPWTATSPCSPPPGASRSATCLGALRADGAPRQDGPPTASTASADLHALTDPARPGRAAATDRRDGDAAPRRRPRPARATLFRQSQVPAHARAGLPARVHGVHRRAEPDDPVQGEGPRRRRRPGSRSTPTRR